MKESGWKGENISDGHKGNFSLYLILNHFPEAMKTIELT